jgi:hypothetical protein
LGLSSVSTDVSPQFAVLIYLFEECSLFLEAERSVIPMPRSEQFFAQKGFGTQPNQLTKLK